MNRTWPPYYYMFQQQQFPYKGYAPYYNPYMQMPKNPVYFPQPQPEQETSQNELKQEEKKPSEMTMAEHMEKLNEKLNKLEEEQKKMQDEIDNIKPVNVENVNYKIQDLNVQDLSGTLLVGLTTLSDAENLKELLAENDAVTFNDMNTDEFEKQMEQMNQMDAEQQDDGNGNNSNNQE
ncbi:coiled-coil domain-containing protein [Oceanobacillus halotolerans]|uniref:spore germination protein GerPC n=1 Tax=Oceanobacillus halotolerans TaxID=2663380 RepID=UPI0013DD3390|nr:spore germination protein GerPC [Oceanobacillus halotolerans]